MYGKYRLTSGMPCRISTGIVRALSMKQKKTDTIRKQNRDRYRTLLIIFAIPALILNSVYIFKCLSDVNVGFWALAPLSALPEVFSCRKLLRHFTITALPQSVIRTREFSYCSRGVSHLQQKKNANHT